MPVYTTITETPAPVRIWTRDVQPEALAQLEQVARLPVIHHHVAAMPDVHAGIGSTVGAVIPTRQAIIPAAVGVDIGCGMLAARLSLDAGRLPDHLTGIRDAIEARVPVGFAAHPDAEGGARAAGDLRDGYRRLVDRHPPLGKRQKDRSRWLKQLGTLGGGNHFIELCLDESDQVWIMLHSGSRGIGNRIGQHFIALAKEDMLRQGVSLPDKDLAYFREGSEHFDDYVEAVHWAQAYAAANRRRMLQLLLEALRRHLPPFEVIGQAVNCHHNYVQKETHYGAEVYLTRKGAIRAGKGELGIIPGSMGAKSYIVRGRGNPESFHSCAHGAGRAMSRTAARKRFSVHDLETQTHGVECRKDRGVLDEAPLAYKNIDEVMANQQDLVEVVHTLKQVVCVKG